jgi:hypothetical protein
MNLQFYINFLMSLTIIILSFVFVNKFYNHFRRNSCIKNFVNYISVLDFHLSKAYNLIHKDQILTYSLDGARVKEEDIDKISEDFVRLTIKLIGPSLYREFVTLYGNDDTFIFNVIEYFNTRYEDDSIRKQALDNFTSEEEGP